MAAQLLIYDPEAERACSGNCRCIRQVAQEAFGPGEISIDEIHQLSGAWRGRQPDVVVHRVPAAPTLKDDLRRLRERWTPAPILGAVCGVPQDTPELADLLRYGFDDFFHCPVSEIDLIARLRRWLPRSADARVKAQPALRCLRLETLVGETDIFLQAIGRIPRLAHSTATVLIAGETGSGKELFARAVHYNSDRQSLPFIPVNCGALPDHLVENELFGHVKGAYTDAGAAEKGLLAEADGGTIFLDEVDTLSCSAQAKLLRFLQDREYKPLGSSKVLTSDARVIAASNADLRVLVAQRLFREDLFHRLNILLLHIPSLRERIADIPLLANHFLARFTAQYKRGGLRFSGGAIRKMMAYSWPGNVREMEGLVHRAVVFATGDTITTEDVEIPEPVGARIMDTASGRKDDAMAEFERRYLVDLLAQHHGNVSHAAKAAGKDRRTLQRSLRRHSIQRVAFQNAS
jgi:DNA-binding NtrC family response regulator